MEGIIISTLYPEEIYHYMWRRVSPCCHGIADLKKMEWTRVKAVYFPHII
jgi:hypothetical protein